MRLVYIVLDAAREAEFAATSCDTLPVAYRRRVAAMRSEAARARTVAGLWLLGRVLADDPGAPPQAMMRVGFSAQGRPEIAGGPWFSISHSDALVACAVSSVGPIGLDVEKRRPGISDRLRAAIDAADDDFFAAWCAREATVKASGRVGLARVRAVTLSARQARLDGQFWPIRPIVPAAGYAGCLAVAPSARAVLSSPPVAEDFSDRS